MTTAPFPFQRFPGNHEDGEPKPSLLERLRTSGAVASHPPQPKPFDMGEPFQQGGLWCFWLTADDEILQYVATLNCVLSATTPPFTRPTRGRRLFSINPRYQYDETWMWLYRHLETETEEVALADMWEQTLDLMLEDVVGEEDDEF